MSAPYPTATDLFGHDARPAAAMGSHQSAVGGADEWLTPPWLIQALGPFDLDPCAPMRRPWDTADEHLTIEQDGLSHEWYGRVWLNPPYSRAAQWLHRLAEHGTGTALLFARTETAMWHTHIWPRASAVLFIRGRLHFHYLSGKRAPANAGAPSALVAYGADDADALNESGIAGKFLAVSS